MQRQAIEFIVQAEEAGSLNQCRVSQIDLTGDGKPESVVIFRVGSHGSQVRALSWQAEKATVLFENGSNTPHTAFCLVEGVPKISLKRTESAGRAVTQLVYQWDGQTFAPSQSDGCALGQDSLRWEECSSEKGDRY